MSEVRNYINSLPLSENVSFPPPNIKNHNKAVFSEFFNMLHDRHISFESPVPTLLLTIRTPDALQALNDYVTKNPACIFENLTIMLECRDECSDDLKGLLISLSSTNVKKVAFDNIPQSVIETLN